MRCVVMLNTQGTRREMAISIGALHSGYAMKSRGDEEIERPRERS